MKKNKTNSKFQDIQSRPSKYIITACMDGKVVEQKDFYFVNEAFIYARDMRSQGYTTEQRTVPNPKYNGVPLFCANSPRITHKQHAPINKRKGWAQKVVCTTTGVVYPTIHDCEKSVGVSGYRIRNSIRKGESVEGLRFEYV